MLNINMEKFKARPGNVNLLEHAFLIWSKIQDELFYTERNLDHFSVTYRNRALNLPKSTF